MSVPVVKAETTAWLGFTCYDKDGLADTPTTLKYRIDCLTTGEEIRADTSITPAVQSGEIVLVPADTTLESQDNVTELRVVTVTADADTDTQHIEQYKLYCSI